MSAPLQLELVARLVCAAIAGGLLGFERDVQNRPAGLRTHALVAIGAGLFTLAGTYGFEDGPPGSAAPDPARVAAQVVSGLGFIGAGTIIRDRGTVRGLTTASTIWASGALGVAFAAGGYVFATATLLLSLVVLVGFRRFRGVSHRIGRSPAALDFEYEIGHGTMGPILGLLEELGVRPAALSIDDDGTDPGARMRRLHIDVLCEHEQLDRLNDVVIEVQARPEVRSAAVGREAIS